MKKDDVWERLKKDSTEVYGRPILDVFLEVADDITRKHLMELPEAKRRAANPEARAKVAETSEELAEAIKDGANGEAALKKAADLGNMEFVKKLVEANPRVRTSWPLWWAASKGHSEVAKFLAEKGDNDIDWAVRGAIEGGHAELAGWLIDKAKEDGRHVDLEYALHLAVLAGSLEGVRLCVEKGAKDIKDAKETAARRLLGHQRRRIIGFLEKVVGA